MRLTGEFPLRSLAARPRVVAAARLQRRVLIGENLDWREFIDRYDRPGTLFYLDPPYFGNESDYGKGAFARDRFAEMSEHLATIKGRLMISLNDRPEVREIFSSFPIAQVDLTYTVAGNGGKHVGEVVILYGKEPMAANFPKS